MYDEPGRIVYRTKDAARYPGEGTDCRSHWFRVVRQGAGGRYFLLVQHGGGDQRVSLGYNYRNYAAMFDPLTPDARFWLMWQMLEIYNEARMEAAKETAHKYEQAFVEGRLKKRKLPARGHTKVWIETPR